MDDDEVLRAEDVAELLQLHIDYVRRKRREGVIPCNRLPGGRNFRYFKGEVLDWLRALPVGDAGHDKAGFARLPKEVRCPGCLNPPSIFMRSAGRRAPTCGAPGVQTGHEARELHRTGQVAS